jgi:ribokinase
LDAEAGMTLPADLVVTGALNWDINLFVKRLPRAGEEVVVERVDRVPGGKGGNVSVAASRILGPKKVALLACVGKDEIGKKQVSILKQDGVDTSAVQTLIKLESGQAYITVDEKGRNNIETHFGANAGLKREHVMLPEVQKLFGNCRMMVVIDPPRHVAGRILSEGRRLRRSVLWHPGVLTRFGMEEFASEMDGLDYLVLNEHEALAFAGSHTLAESVASFNKIAPKMKILVTLGSKGFAFYDRGKQLKMKSINLAKMGRKIVNTTGCGDAFVGSFAAYKVLGLTDNEALKHGNMAAALKAGRMETRGSPTRKELEEFFQKYSA